MKNPFSLERKIDGVDTRIYYNTPAFNLSETLNDQYNILEGDFINTFENTSLEELELDIDVEMDVLQKQQIEMNKAMMMFGQGALALKDYLRIMYPEEWRERFENIQSQNQAQQLMGMIQEVQKKNPQLVGEVMKQLQNVIQFTESQKQ